MKIFKDLFEMFFVSIKTDEADNFLKHYHKRERRKRFYEYLEELGQIEGSAVNFG